MTTLREAAQKALEALEDMLGWGSLAPQSVQDSSKQSLQRLREALGKMESAQVSPVEFVNMVLEKEHLIGRPVVWAEWPTRSKE